MVQDRIYSYFEGNPQLHVLLKLNLITNEENEKVPTVTFMKTKNA